MLPTTLIVGSLAMLLALTGCAVTGPAPAASGPDASASTPLASSPATAGMTDTPNATPARASSATASLPRQVEGSIVRFTARGVSVDVVIGADSATTRDFLSMLPLTLTLEEFSGREKIGYLPRKLDTAGSPGSDPEDGDLIYFVPWRTLGFYYNTAGIGHSDQVIHLGTYKATAELLEKLQGGDVTVTWPGEARSRDPCLVPIKELGQFRSSVIVQLRSTNPEVHSLKDLIGDLARMHRTTSGGDRGVEPEQIQADLAALERDGYVVLADRLSRDEFDSLRAELITLLGQTGRNAFEGHRAQRIHSVLNKTRCVQPGEDAQLLHPDDGFYPVPRPRPELSVATIWAIDDFTEANGATVLIPGSHRWPDGRTPTGADSRLAAAMPAGSCACSSAPSGTAAAPTTVPHHALPPPPSTVSPGCGPRRRSPSPPATTPPAWSTACTPNASWTAADLLLGPGLAPTTSQWPGIIARVLGGQRPHRLDPTEGPRFRYRIPYRLRSRRARLTLYEPCSPSSAPRRSTSLRGYSASFVRRPRC
ncbi:cyclophilin-like fold protein [Actinomadura litoris]|uniref:cyclophilin-like fold protein n=1 Tax=Actinomadura litoris TaxID=2678616 RepID=UPI001C12AB65|nr:cyclophilin-like fold protein [Actinomadura litoris]